MHPARTDRMKNYVIAYRPGPHVENIRELLVEASSIEVAVDKARRLLFLRYPNYRLTGAWPGMDFDSDAEEIFAARRGGSR